MEHNTSTADAKAAAESLVSQFEYERLLNQGKSRVPFFPTHFLAILTFTNCSAQTKPGAASLFSELLMADQLSASPSVPLSAPPPPT